MGAAVSVNPLAALSSGVFVVTGGGLTAACWLRTSVERKRFAADVAEATNLLAECEAEYLRWCARLTDRPSESEMARWLDGDRKVLMDEALRHYKLRWSGVLAHAFIEAPSGSCRRARTQDGPLRYARYQLLVFLLTPDGVRQWTAYLNTETSALTHQHRMNYRFDAVASVRVTGGRSSSRTLLLTLVNGEPIAVPLIELSASGEEDEEKKAQLSDLTLDAAGLPNTLHLLEGIAAEGKGWIEHERRRGEGREAALRSAVEHLLG
jgi:hypothetical protein